MWCAGWCRGRWDRAGMLKQYGLRFILLLFVVLFCFAFASEVPFYERERVQNLQDMQVEDIHLSVLDTQTVRLENRIKGRGLAYGWVIHNTINGERVENEEMQVFEDNDVIEIGYQDLDALSFQAIVEYEGVRYESNTFLVASNGTVMESAISNAKTTSLEHPVARGVEDIVSLAYVCFLAFTALLYYLVPKPMQRWVLLAASLFFYLLSGVQFIGFVLFSSWLAFAMAKKMTRNALATRRKIDKEDDAATRKKHKLQLQHQNRRHLALALIGTLGVMITIKYTAFAAETLNSLLGTGIPLLQMVMPLGLSFYTFMLLSYLFDVYRGKIEAESRFSKLLLYVCFFPHVAQGPIARFGDLAVQFEKKHSFDFQNLCFASQRILWGFFIKLVVADRIGVFVDAVYGGYESQAFGMLVLATFAYSLQIYTDFYSSMEIAIGSAQVFGITLSENFMRPYFSTTMPEFWRRWHITLGTWFRDYVFYPISMSALMMKLNVKTRQKWGVHVSRVLAAAPPILGVWVLTGLWHGAAWNFVAWGLFHGLLILLSTAFDQPFQNRLKKWGVPVESGAYKVLQMVKVFFLCSLGRVFFRAESVWEAFDILGRIVRFSVPSAAVDVLQLHFEPVDGLLVLGGLLSLFVVSFAQEHRHKVRAGIAEMHLCARWCIWLGLLMTTVLFGMYGPNTAPVFLYEAF